MGLYFGFSEFTVSQYLEELKPILKSSLCQNNELKTVIFKDQLALDEAFNGINEIPIERSQNKDVQERYIGKKNNIRLNGL